MEEQVAETEEEEEIIEEDRDFAGGEGTEEDPYLIKTAEHLHNIRENLDAHFKLIDDVNLEKYENWNPIGEYDFFTLMEDYPEDNKPFFGQLDGDGHTIKNLTIDRPDTDFVGLFAYVGRDEEILRSTLHRMFYGETEVEPKIKNLNLENVDIAGNEWVGAIAGSNGIHEADEKGEMKNIEVNGEIKGEIYVGGILGENNEGGTITQAHFTGEVRGIEDIGGVVGMNFRGNISKSSAEASIFGEHFAGGIAGANEEGSISQSYARGEVIGHREGDLRSRGVGGLAGHVSGGSIKNNYSIADVKGNRNVGGFIGELWIHEETEVKYTYNSGSVSGEAETENIDSFIGKLDTGGEFHANHINQERYDISPILGHPQSTEEMLKEDTFTATGWNFDNIWTIEEGKTYPFFQWQDDNTSYP